MPKCRFVRRGYDSSARKWKQVIMEMTGVRVGQGVCGDTLETDSGKGV